MDERRKSQRHRALKNAVLVFNDGRSTITGTLRNVSDSGALVRVASTMGIPETVELSISGAARVPCRVVRRTLTDLGVRFESQG